MPKLTDKTALTTLADGDLIHTVDVSDTTSDPAGTSKGIAASDMKTYMADYELIETQTASTSTEIDFVLPSGYTSFKVIASGIQTTTGTTSLYFRTSSDGGSTFDSTSGNYSYTNFRVGTGTTAIYESATDTFIELTRSSLSYRHTSIILEVINPTDSNYTDIIFKSKWPSNGLESLQSGNGVAVRAAAASIDAIRFYPSSSDFATGTFKLYGIK